jgi:hypothetical protein
MNGFYVHARLRSRTTAIVRDLSQLRSENAGHKSEACSKRLDTHLGRVEGSQNDEKAPFWNLMVICPFTLDSSTSTGGVDCHSWNLDCPCHHVYSE